MRAALKRQLARLPAGPPAEGATLLIYHRVGGGSPDERDLPTDAFAAQLEVLDRHEVVSLDDALDRLDAGDRRPTVVLTFDDGFRDVAANAWPLLDERELPFTLYLTAGLVDGAEMRWEGSTATAAGEPLRWADLDRMIATGRCTVGNHTLTHARPDALTEEDLDACSALIEQRLGARPRHFAYTWGVPVPRLRDALGARFRSVATGGLGRNLPDTDRLALRRVPVRGSDPLPFFEAKLRGGLRAERSYDLLVRGAKRLGRRA